MSFSREWKGPDMFFNFDGRSSALGLPDSFRWPSKGGFSFCTWLRIESFSDPENK
jgi:hypothetical protein